MNVDGVREEIGEQGKVAEWVADKALAGRAAAASDDDALIVDVGRLGSTGAVWNLEGDERGRRGERRASQTKRMRIFSWVPPGTTDFKLASISDLNWNGECPDHMPRGMPGCGC